MGFFSFSNYRNKSPYQSNKSPNSVLFSLKSRSAAASLVYAYPIPKSAPSRKPHAPQNHSKFRSKNKFCISLRMGNCLGGICELFHPHDHTKKDEKDGVFVEKDNNNNVHEVIDIDDDDDDGDKVMQDVSDDSSIEEVNVVRDGINVYGAKNTDYEEDDFVYKKLHQMANKRNSKISGLRSDIEEKQKSWEGLRKRKGVTTDLVEEWFTPLTEEDESLVAEALSNRNRRVVVVSHENTNIDITGEKMQCLRNGGWLNDEVINVYLALLKEREKREPEKFLKCHFFNTFFYKQLNGRGGYSFKSVQRWTTQKKLGYSLLECDKIFVPIHRPGHWCLAIINMREEKIQYLDSFKGVDNLVLDVLAKYYVDEVKDKSGKEIDISSWELENVLDLPEQVNGYDCGMFMVKYADFYSRDMGLCFSQGDMPYFRKRTAKELLRLKAD